MEGKEIVAWVAKDEDGDVYLYFKKPKKNKVSGKCFTTHTYRNILKLNGTPLEAVVQESQKLYKIKFVL